MYAILRVFMCVKILARTRSQVIDSPYDPLEILAVHVRLCVCGIYISIWIPCFTILILDVVLKKGLLVDNYWLPNDSVYSF